MASLFERRPERVKLLEAGAGVGSLLAAFTIAACRWDRRPKELSIVAYEVDALLVPRLRQTLSACRTVCEAAGIKFRAEVKSEDFIAAGAAALGDLFAKRDPGFNCTILNPPYHKLNSASDARYQLRSVGVETSNLYTAFLALAVKLLDKGGELVAITPRSYCNGPYFKPFRKMFLDAMTIRQMHLFDSRGQAFRDDKVLQENVIVHAVKEQSAGKVVISSGSGVEDESRRRDVPYGALVHTDDPDKFIRIVTDETASRVVGQMRSFTTPLPDLEVAVSTGRVVDFRAREFLLAEPTRNSVPLIYPGHILRNYVAWPRANYRKANALAVSPATQSLVLPKGAYVVVKRFSSKEERRRIVAAIYDPSRICAQQVGFENHLNVYHVNNRGLSMKLAKGLALYLNSTLVDQYFRQFNGHTQVNATDLRSLKYPTTEQLLALGEVVADEFPPQDQIDIRIHKLLAKPRSRSHRLIRA